MKKLNLILTAFLFACTSAFAQDYQISFSAGGDASAVETVEIQNLTQGTSLNLNGDDILHLVDVVTGVEQVEYSGQAVFAYPNPMRNSSRIFFSVEKPDHYRIEVYNLNGTCVASTTTKQEKGTHSFRLSGLSSGVYTVNVHSSSFNESFKLIAQGKSQGNIQLTHNSAGSNSFPNTLKSGKNLVQMQYNDGDRLLLQASAENGNYLSRQVIVPTQSEAVTFMFYSATDNNGYTYPTVTIGDQVWMAENLRATSYPDGTAIPQVTDNTEWANLADNNTDDAYCFYNNDNTTDYGALYTYAAAIGDNWARDNDPSTTGGQGVCPDGWHIATWGEWDALFDYLGGNAVAGGMLKETGTTHWASPNTDASNETGFTALPEGERDADNGVFYSESQYAYFWTGDHNTDGSTRYWRMFYNNAAVIDGYYSKSDGFSVRCVRD